MSGPFDIFGLGADPDRPEESPARKAQIASGRPLPKRFYDKVEVAAGKEGFLLHLDGRPVRTPARKIVALPYQGVAEALADEWRTQEKTIDPKKMPLTRLVNSALDGVSGMMAEVREEIVRFAGTDLLCYRAETPERLVARQSAHWDPVIEWAQARYGCRFALAAGVLHVAQAKETLSAIDGAVAAFGEPLRLAALHSMTALLGSCLLALAVAEGRLEMEEAWKAAHVDEDWNIEQWGEDHEAKLRRDYRFQEMKAAALIASAS